MHSSCGYQSGSSLLIKKYKTISIPYVEGDREGHLTAEVAKQIASLGNLKYQADAGDLWLKIETVSSQRKAIGFRHTRDIDGNLTKNISPTEDRLLQEVVISVIESESGQVILGPATIKATIDYDYEASVYKKPVLHESLGQLDQPLEAATLAHYPLYRELAKRIAYFVYHSK
jgi:hypothetical protein